MKFGQMLASASLTLMVSATPTVVGQTVRRVKPLIMAERPCSACAPTPLCDPRDPNNPCTGWFNRYENYLKIAG